MADRTRDPIPAATLVLMRMAPAGPEVLVMERAHDMAFAPGAIVFPGGRVEPDDHLLAERMGADIGHAPSRIAAIRETIEEVGIAAGFVHEPDPDLVARLRSDLRAGEPLSGLLDQFGLTLALEPLTPFAHWYPPPNLVRRFDTLFFLAGTATQSQVPEADREEAVRSFWASPHALLEAADAGGLSMLYPTRCTLQRLARFAGVEDARADAAAHGLRTIVPWMEERDGVPWICIPDGIGYPVTAERMDMVRRD